MSSNHDLVDEAAFFPPGHFCPKGTFKAHTKKGRHLILVDLCFMPGDEKAVTLWSPIVEGHQQPLKWVT